MATAEASVAAAPPPSAPAQAGAAGAPADAAAAEPPKEEEGLAPVIVIKKVMDDGHGGAHGGAWKIALADMMTAMMAFFLLMWLLGASNSSQRKSIADYFKPTSHSQVEMGKLAGSNGILGGRSIIDPDGFPFSAKQTATMERLTPRSEGGPTENDPSPNSQEHSDPQNMSEDEKKKAAEQLDKENFDKLEKELEKQLESDPKLAKLKDQVKMTREKDGMRIEIIDKADFAMFDSGTNALSPKAKKLMDTVAKSVTGLNNKVTVQGNTDSVQFNGDDGRNNWSLSAERADSTRQLLEKSGVDPKRITRIEGVADTQPFNPKDPFDPRNRRISIKLLYQDQ